MYIPDFQNPDYNKIFYHHGVRGLSLFTWCETEKPIFEINQVKIFQEGDRRVILDDQGKLYLVLVPIEDEEGNRVETVTWPKIRFHLGPGCGIARAIMLKD
jgi:hypothetical protein